MFSVSDCIAFLREKNLLVDGVESSQEITGVSFNSKEVKPGFLFICKGEYFKKEYLAEAISKGISCYVSEIKYEDLENDVPWILVNDVRQAMIEIGLFYYKNPSHEIDIAAFTGTKGKTTATHMMESTIEAWKNPCGMISTVYMDDGIERVDSYNTTPEPTELQFWLRKMVDNKLEFCSLEVSSQALRYGRTDGVRFKVASFMNIARDHIGPKEHKDFEDYYTAKLAIFDQTEVGIVNLDMELVDRTLEYAKSHCPRVLTYSLQNPDSDFYCYDIKKDGIYTVFKIKSDLFENGVEEFAISMPGWFNVSNSVVVIASAFILGEPVDKIRLGIKDAKVDGRMEVYPSEDGKVIAIVDYAHNKISYESLFKAVEEDYPEHSKNIKIIFGSLGGKAFERREELGTIAGQRAHFSYISADSPCFEPFEKIANEIAHYVELQGGKYKIIEDRNVAIHEAIVTAEEPTIVLAVGFGRINWQRYGNDIVFRETDVECVERSLKEYNEAHK